MSISSLLVAGEAESYMALIELLIKSWWKYVGTLTSSNNFLNNILKFYMISYPWTLIKLSTSFRNRFSPIIEGGGSGWKLRVDLSSEIDSSYMTK